jgi:hypothetical protein
MAAMPENYAEEDKIRLKPFLGLRPGVYLSLIYGALILGALFFLFLFPGISRPGSVVTVKSEPWGAAVRLDGVYQGSAPRDFFVPQGSHSLELVLPGFESRKIEAEIPGRPAFSLFFPRRLSFEERLFPENAKTPPGGEAVPDGGALGIIAGAGADYAAWTFAGEPTDAYQIPQSLSEGFYRAGPYLAGDKDARKEAGETLRAAARFALTKAALRDLIRAKALADNGGLSPSPLSLLRSTEEALSWLDENAARSGETASWLAGLLPADMAGSLRSSSWFAARSGDSPGNRPEGTGQDLPAGPEDAGGRISAGGLYFREIPGVHPELHAGESIYIAETEVSVASYDVFLEAEPRWRRENLEDLVEQGLVNRDYLEPGPGERGNSSETAGFRTGISWYAASAFCAWLKRELPPGWEDAVVRLPTEAEWTAYVQGRQAGGETEFWEWRQDPYAPLAFLSASPGAVERISSPERVLQGGFRIGSLRQGERETRASLPPEFCSPFVSFRPLIVRTPGGGT